MTAEPTRTETLAPSGDATTDTAALAAALAWPGRVRLGPGRFAVRGGLVLDAGRALAGTPGGDGQPATTLVQQDAGTAPLLHLLGSDTAVEDLALDVPAVDIGRHDGDQCTAVTVGRYLYPGPAEWIERVALTRVRVDRAGRCSANSVGLMGAVRDVTVDDLRVTGGGTGLAVHWGAVGRDVHAVTGPSYHPHRLTVRGLTVRDAFEGFYLSSVHDVDVEDVTLDGVDIGFRLLPGDNTDRFSDGTGTAVSSRVRVARGTVGWSGVLYAARLAGWGRSEVDGVVTTLAYRDLSVRDLRVDVRPPRDGAGDPADPAAAARLARRPRTVLVVENVPGAATAVRDVTVTGADVPLVTVDGEAATLPGVARA